MPVLAGVLSVMIAGVRLIVTLPVVIWVSLERTRHGRKLTSVEEVVRYCLMMFNALVKNHTYGIAVTVDGIKKTVTMVKTWVLNVTDTSFIYTTTDHFIGLKIFESEIRICVYVSFIEE